MEKELEKYKKDVTTKVAKALDTSYNYGFHDGYVKARKDFIDCFSGDNIKEYLKQNGWTYHRDIWWNPAGNSGYNDSGLALIEQLKHDKNCIIIRKKV